MSGLEIAFGIVLLVFAVGIIAIVLLQEGQQRNPGVITGGSSDTFLSKHQGRSIDAFLARWTRFIAVGFFIFVIVVNIILFFLPGRANAGANPDVNSGVTSSVTSALSSEPIADLIHDDSTSTVTASQPQAASTPASSSAPADNTSAASASASAPQNSSVSAGSQAAG